jgi:RNA polymerase sigma-70 factor (ECF subfamily)
MPSGLVAKVRTAREFKKRAKAAYDEVVRAEWDNLWAYARSRGRDAHRAEDLTQAAFLGAWNGIEKLRQPAAFRGYLRRIVRRLSADDARDPVVNSGDREDADPKPAPEAIIELFERLLEIAWEFLPTRLAIAFALTLRGEQPANIATLFQKTSETVRTWILRARARVFLEVFKNQPAFVGGREAVREGWERAAATAKATKRLTNEEKALFAREVLGDNLPLERSRKPRQAVLHAAVIKVLYFIHPL